MEPEGIHELTAAYALDALDEHECEEFERHLRHCARCREELVELREAATSLAYAAPAAAQPDALRSRILEQARAERGKVVPFPARVRNRRTAILAAATAVAAAAAVALGIWAAILDRDLGHERSARARDAQALALIAAPDTMHVPVAGGPGSLAVAPSGRAALVLSNLRPAAAGQTYEAWVIEDATPAPAGLFEGGRRTILMLSHRVRPGSTVAVTIERAGGVAKPSRPPILSARV